MELTPTSGKAFTNAGQTMEYRISNENAGFIMDILATKLYSDPLMAPIREIVTNAFDAHLMSGKKDSPILLKLPYANNLKFVVRDYGPGIAPDKMESFFSFGDSNKRHSNEATGGFGIGSKSPFAIADSFTTTIFIGGKKYIWQSFKKEGKPNSALLLAEPTTEPTGVEVVIPIHPDSLQTFNERIRSFLAYVQSPYKIEGGTLIKIPAPAYFLKEDKETVFQIYKQTVYRTGLMVRMGDIAYKIPRSVLTNVVSNWSSDLFYYKTSVSPGVRRWANSTFPFLGVQDTLIFDLPIGALTISPNREEVVDSSKNQQVLTAFFKDKLDAALTKAYENFCSKYSTDLGTFVSHMFAACANGSTNSTIGDYVCSILMNPSHPLYVKFGLEKYFKGLDTKSIENYFHVYSKTFAQHIMSNPDFIDDVGLVCKVKDAKELTTPKKVTADMFFETSRLKKRHTLLQAGDVFVNYAKTYESCFGTKPIETPPVSCSFLGRYVGGNPNYKSLTGRCFATKTLAEIKDPVYRWFVAYHFLNTTEEEAEPPTPKKRKAVLTTTVETPPVYRFYRGWEEYAPKADGFTYIVLRYNSGASFAFSEDPYLSSLIEQDPAKYTSANFRREMSAIIERSHIRLIALRHDMEIPKEIENVSFTISDLNFGKKLINLYDQTSSNAMEYYFVEKVLGKEFYKAATQWNNWGQATNRFGDSVPNLLKEFEYLPLINQGQTFQAPPPPSLASMVYASILRPSNLSDYVLKCTPIDPANTKLVTHLNTYYAAFLNKDKINKYILSISNAVESSDYHKPGVLMRYMPLLAAAYFERDLSQADTLFKDLWPCYIKEVLEPLMAAFIPKLEKR